MMEAVASKWDSGRVLPRRESFRSHRAYRRCLRVVLLFTLTLLPPLARAAGAPVPSVESLGFTSLDATPLDFTLPTLDGKAHHLTEFRGKWTWLAFWATWCGPCNQEIPELEALYREYKAKGLQVIGVSVDQDQASVASFQKEKAISFPILLDLENKIAAKYRASALPTLYLISPDWKLVGVMQGARDWTSPEVKAQVERLLGVHKYQASGNGVKMTEEDGALSLPNNLAPPELTLELGGELRHLTTFRKGEVVPLIVVVTWKTNPKDYLIKVPKVTVPEGVSIGEVASSSSSVNDRIALKYRFPLTLEKEGSFKIGPVELAYSPRAGGKELFSRHEGTVIDVTKESWGRTALAVGVGLVVVLAGGILLALRKMRRKKRNAAVPAAPSRRNWSEPYEKIRQMKLMGRKDEYMSALLRLNLEIEQASGAPSPATVSLLEKLRFGGAGLSEVELTSFEKKIERAIKESSS